MDGGAGEPGFETGGAMGLPDMRDEPSFEDVLAGMEEAMGDGGAGADTGNGGMKDGQTGSYPGGGGPSGQGKEAGTAGQPGGNDGTGAGSRPAGGPLTPAEQVAILDAQLEKGTGEFDSMILDEQVQQRQASRDNAGSSAGESQAAGGGSSGNYGDSAGQGGGVAAGGSYGGGIGGVGGGGEIPKDVPKYPPPDDIPDGDDDDVVARQLREAAMREPDPAVREKLWDEYRKYKGIAE